MTEHPGARPPLDSDRLRDALAQRVPQAQVDVEPTAPSTNALLAERARAGEPEWRVLVTEHQTAGRGRLDRSWETPPRAALTFSVLLRPVVRPAQWPWLPLLTGLAVVRGLDELLGDGGPTAGLKWPNDVLVGDAKLAGILVERVEGPTGAAAVVGIGLNVSTTRDELPVPTATSLLEAGAGVVDRTDLLVALLTSLRREYDAWQGGAGDLREAYTRRCVTLGRTVRVELPAGGASTGLATGVDPGGRLVVRTATGEVAVGAGDVVHVRSVERPAD